MTGRGWPSSASTTWVGAGVGLLCAVIVLGPALSPGYTLHYDLVHVPELRLSARTLGIDGSVPRAVPNDLVVALASLLLPGWLVQKAVLLTPFVLGGAGIGRLSRTAWGAGAGGVLWGWNAWVGERLGIGHWGYLLGYAALPWVLVALGRLRRGEIGRGRAVLPVVLGGLGGSTAGLLVTVLAVAVVVLPGGAPARRLRERAGDTVAVLLAAVGTAAAWLWPFLTAASRAADPYGVEAFAARADTPLGLLGSAVLGGGLWNDRTWFVERASLPVSLLAVLLTVVTLLAALRRPAWWQDPVRPGAALAGAAGLLLAVAAGLPGGQRLLTAVVSTVPGGGLLRDGHKMLGLWLLLVALAAAAAADALAERGLPSSLLLPAVLWPVATLPTLALGHLGAWGSVPYPPAVLRVADRLASSEEPVAVLPWATYRRYSWNADRVVLDPWDRLLPGGVLADDRLPLREGTVAGEDPAAARVSRVVAEHGDVVAALRAEGVRLVLVQTDQPDPLGSADGLGEPVVVEGSLAVHDLGEPPSGPSPGPPVSPTRGMGLLGAAATVLLSLTAWVRGIAHGRRRPAADGARPRPRG